MKRNLLYRIFLTAIIFLTFAPLSLWSQPRGESNDWLLGDWEGIFTRSYRADTRTLELTDLRAGTEGKTSIAAKFGITGKNMGPVNVVFSDGTLSFTTPASARIEVKKMSSQRMKGTLTPKNCDETECKPLDVTFWKKTSPADQKCKAFIGTWKGSWSNGLVVRMAIKYCDADAVALLYTYGDLPKDNIKSGQMWPDAKIDTAGQIIFDAVKGRSSYIFSLSKDLKELKGSMVAAAPSTGRPTQVNEIVMTRVE